MICNTFLITILIYHSIQSLTNCRTNYFLLNTKVVTLQIGMELEVGPLKIVLFTVDQVSVFCCL